jgi:predicted enzyme related to lactoylglutathione lyase
MSFTPRLIVLYVRDVAASRAFYEPIFGAPLEATADFAMFETGAGLRLAVWAVETVAPAARLAPGGCEICAPMAEADVLRLHRDWSARGVAIAQEPTRLDFGLSVLALDPDGHRLRLFHPAD